MCCQVVSGSPFRPNTRVLSFLRMPELPHILYPTVLSPGVEQWSCRLRQLVFYSPYPYSLRFSGLFPVLVPVATDLHQIAACILAPAAATVAAGIHKHPEAVLILTDLEAREISLRDRCGE